MSLKFERIALVTTVSNKYLYKKTVSTFPKQVDLIAIDGTEGLYGLNSIKFIFKKLSARKYDWVVLVDEDVVFVDTDYIFKIIENMSINNITVTGIRDGGILSWRDKNPYLINPFFCVLDFKKIKSFYNQKEMEKNQYIVEDEFNDDLSDLKYNFDTNSLFEKYYCFFLYLRRKGMKFKFLEAFSDTFENDLETTTVLADDSKVILYHTWYARTYGTNDYHTKRIDKILSLGMVDNFNKKIKITWIKDNSFNLNKKIKRFKNRVINRLKKII